jgi:hypothetical protein
MILLMAGMVFAGGSDLPDVIIGPIPIAVAIKYGQAGMIVPTEHSAMDIADIIRATQSAYTRMNRQRCFINKPVRLRYMLTVWNGKENNTAIT